MIPILQMKKLRHREVEYLAQGHPVVSGSLAWVRTLYCKLLRRVGRGMDPTSGYQEGPLEAEGHKGKKGEAILGRLGSQEVRASGVTKDWNSWFWK